MIRPRDSQRKKFWDAYRKVQSLSKTCLTSTNRQKENVTSWLAIFKPGRFHSPIFEGETSFILRSTKNDCIKFKANPFYDGIKRKAEIFLPKQFNLIDLTKWYCHLIQPDSTAWHGPEYCAIFLEALSMWSDYHKVFVEEFNRAGVKHRRTLVIEPETSKVNDFDFMEELRKL